MNLPEPVPYNDLLDPVEQLDTEEQLAAMLFDHPDIELHEETAAEMARDLLYYVLRVFRPDFFDDED